MDRSLFAEDGELMKEIYGLEIWDSTPSFTELLSSDFIYGLLPDIKRTKTARNALMVALEHSATGKEMLESVRWYVDHPESDPELAKELWDVVTHIGTDMVNNKANLNEAVEAEPDSEYVMVKLSPEFWKTEAGVNLLLWQVLTCIERIIEKYE